VDVAPSISPDFAVPPAFDHFLVFIWAVSGAIVGVRKGFDLIGMQLALERGLPVSGVLLIGFINGTGGGLLRDVLVRDVPALFQPGGYAALVVLLACCLFVTLVLGLGVHNHAAAVIAIAAGFVVRLLTIRFNWRTSPVMPER
jgi:uncharacterized membrane protein YeiH